MKLTKKPFAATFIATLLDQLIIEVPAGGKYCPVREALWSLVRKDREASGSHSKRDTIKFVDPPEVTVLPAINIWFSVFRSQVGHKLVH